MMQGLRNNFLARRWRGEVPVRRLFWRDMLGIGTLVNLLASFAALGAAAAGVPMAWAVALHFSPMPWNVFLFAALWRRPDRPGAMAVAAAVWLALMTVL